MEKENKLKRGKLLPALEGNIVDKGHKDLSRSSTREVPTHTQRKACYSQTSVVCVKKSSQKFYYKTEP